MTYRMVSETELGNFRRFMRSGIPLKEFSPQGAFDGAHPRARDQEDPEEPKGRPTYLDALHALKRKMSPEGFRSLLMAFLDDDEPAEDDALPLRANGEVAPARASDKPETAQDRALAVSRIALDAYHRRFPNAPRGVRYTPEIGKPMQRSAADARGYASRFPDAASVRGAQR